MLTRTTTVRPGTSGRASGGQSSMDPPTVILSSAELEQQKLEQQEQQEQQAIDVLMGAVSFVLAAFNGSETVLSAGERLVEVSFSSWFEEDLERKIFVTDLDKELKQCLPEDEGMRASLQGALVLGSKRNTGLIQSLFYVAYQTSVSNEQRKKKVESTLRKFLKLDSVQGTQFVSVILSKEKQLVTHANSWELHKKQFTKQHMASQSQTMPDDSVPTDANCSRPLVDCYNNDPLTDDTIRYLAIILQQEYRGEFVFFVPNVQSVKAQYQDFICLERSAYHVDDAPIEFHCHYGDVKKAPQLYQMVHDFVGNKKFGKVGLVYGVITLSRVNKKAIDNYYHRHCKKQQSEEDKQSLLALQDQAAGPKRSFVDISATVFSNEGVGRASTPMPEEEPALKRSARLFGSQDDSNSLGSVYLPQAPGESKSSCS